MTSEAIEQQAAAIRARISPEHTRQGPGGERQVKREGIAEAADILLRTVKHYAATDPNFPEPVEPAVRGRTTWYPEPAVIDYALLVEARREAARPGLDPEIAAGDPEELLEPARSAALYQVAYNPDGGDTWGSYVEKSKPFWAQGKPGILPVPDVEEPHGKLVYRRWKLGTLLAHHETHRPGRIARRRASDPGPEATAGD